jgi:hypothetical protein
MALVVVVFGYFWGDLTMAFTNRLGIIFLPFVIFGFCALVQQLASLRWMRCGEATGAKFCAVLGIALCLFHWPVADKNESVEQLTLNTNYQATLAFLQKEYPEHNNLIISQWPGLYSAHRWGSINCELANQQVMQIKQGLKHGLYQNVLTIQVIDYLFETASEETSLNAKFKLESIFEVRFDNSSKVVISRVL